jgi:hypothetical protein
MIQEEVVKARQHLSNRQTLQLIGDRPGPLKLCTLCSVLTHNAVLAYSLRQTEHRQGPPGIEGRDGVVGLAVLFLWACRQCCTTVDPIRDAQRTSR